MLRLVPWESWQIWNEVRVGVFSLSPETALNKIAAWKSRSSLPVSIEVTADLINIQRRDPHFSRIYFAENFITGDLLQLMYSMVIMRLVNGVVDQSKRQNFASVADRAEAAGLPRMLVDIRHEVAHKELPSLPVLQLASKKALEWLKIHYWEAQKQVIDVSSETLKRKLYAYAETKICIDGEQSRGGRRGKDLNDLVKSVSAAVPDVAFILVNEGLMEKCITGDTIWRFVIEELISHVPELSKELMSCCINSGKSGILKTAQIFKFLVDNSPHKAWQSHYAGRLAELSSKAQQLHTVSDGSCESGMEYLFRSMDGTRESQQLSTRDAEGAVETECAVDDEAIEADFKRNECVLSEAKNDLDILFEQKFGTLGGYGGLTFENLKEYHIRDGPSKNVWTVTEDWRPCAIGKLPGSYEATGPLPSNGTTEFTSGDEALVRQETSSPEELVGDAGPVEMIFMDGVLVGDPVTSEVDIEKDLTENGKSNGKRVAAKETVVEEGMNKRFKEDLAGSVWQEGIENSTSITISRPEKPHKSVTGKKSVMLGVLLLDGVYKTCTSAQLAAIQSTIHLLK